MRFKTNWTVALLCCIGMGAALAPKPATAGCNERCISMPIAGSWCEVCRTQGHDTGISCGGNSLDCGCVETQCTTPSFMKPAESENSTPANIVAKNCPAPALLTSAVAQE